MGPLVPEIIGNELNYIVALFVGIAFGFVLEQAGFSTSKKLVGLFYGYDFTVLRVFFTAGVTAMIGLVTLSHFGLIDISLVYINPTFIWSALVGGLIMGLGFVVGGFCPGTSICAAAIGKIDAMVFVAGSFLGVFIFAEGYPLFEDLYKSGNWGSPRIFDLLGMSQSVFAFLLMVVAVGAFWAVTFVEKKVNGFPGSEFKTRKIYFSLTAAAMILALSAFILPDRKEMILNKLDNKSMLNEAAVKIMTVDELAFRIIDRDRKLRIFDLRSTKDFEKLSLPESQNITLQNIFEKEIQNELSVKNMRNVFVADDEITARKAAFVSQELGRQHVSILEGGMDNFVNQIINFKTDKPAQSRSEIDQYRFRAKASRLIPELIKENKEKQKSAAPKKAKRVVGGC